MKKNVSSDMKAKFLHLLALLVSVKVIPTSSNHANFCKTSFLVQHDDPSAIATAVALCQSARQGTATNSDRLTIK
jgi:hypothetical protein